MLETVLTRIILRYAQRYICDTIRTDSLSLWGGDLRIQNFELRTDELARLLGTEAGGLRLTRGFVRELRIHVPWNAIRSQSLRVEINAVEVIFTSGGGGHSGSGRARESCPEDAETEATAAAPPASTSQEALDETSETWLQPLLRTMCGNAAVSADNLVAKLSRNGAVGCVTLGRLDSKPHSPYWEAGFQPIAGPKPILYRVVSVRDFTITLDHVQTSEKRLPGGGLRRGLRYGKSSSRSVRHAALPILHRMSVETFVEWPWLPWPGPVTPLPMTRVGVHVSPVRARLTTDQAQLLAQLLLRPDEHAPRRASFSSSGGGFLDAEGDSGSDRYSVPSMGCRPTPSEPSTTAATDAGTVAGCVSEPRRLVQPESPNFSRQSSPLQLANIDPTTPSDPARPNSCPATPTGASMGSFRVSMPPATLSEVFQSEEVDLPKGPTEPQETAKSPKAKAKASSGQDSGVDRRGGFRGFLADVLFGDDEDEDDAENEAENGEDAVPRETRRAWSLTACVPLLSLSLEQSRELSTDESLASSFPATASPQGLSLQAAGPREVSWACTLSLIGLSACALSPPAGATEPVEGSLELHHVALHAPGDVGGPALVALAWGSPLSRSPLEALDDTLTMSMTPVSSGSGSGSGSGSAKTTESLHRAACWVESGRRLLAVGVEFPHSAHHVLGVNLTSPAGHKQGEQEGAETAGGNNAESRESEHAVAGQAAVRLGLLLVPAQRPEILGEIPVSPETECSSGESDDGSEDEFPDGVGAPSVEASAEVEKGPGRPEVRRLSVQLSELKLCLEPSWCAAARDALLPLMQSPSAGKSAPPPATPEVANCSAEQEKDSVMEVVVCSAGISASLGPFDLKLGPVRADWRERPHGLDEAKLFLRQEKEVS
ncbi:unnamed protein product [Polarella glacialis]|uniref:Chorein N-terminal domain-containing protein n=1 Tax=Polarella glacialis TaxID=89957 RepID=A0A813F9B1_POLGL|nr:unnamed protein product [Polarella glacialis]